VCLRSLKPSTSPTTNRLYGPETPHAFADGTGLLDRSCRGTRPAGEGGTGQPAHGALPWEALGEDKSAGLALPRRVGAHGHGTCIASLPRLHFTARRCRKGIGEEGGEDIGLAVAPGAQRGEPGGSVVANEHKPFCSWNSMFWGSTRVLAAPSHQLGLRFPRGSGGGLGGGTPDPGDPQPGWTWLQNRKRAAGDHRAPTTAGAGLRAGEGNGGPACSGERPYGGGGVSSGGRGENSRALRSVPPLLSVRCLFPELRPASTCAQRHSGGSEGGGTPAWHKVPPPHPHLCFLPSNSSPLGRERSASSLLLEACA